MTPCALRACSPPRWVWAALIPFLAYFPSVPVVAQETGCTRSDAKPETAESENWTKFPDGQAAADTTNDSSLRLLKNKQHRTEAEKKLDGLLLQRIAEIEDNEKQPPDLVPVIIRCEVTDALLARIRELGGTVQSSFPEYESIHAQLPVSGLLKLAEDSAVVNMQYALPPMLQDEESDRSGDNPQRCVMSGEPGRVSEESEGEQDDDKDGAQ